MVGGGVLVGVRVRVGVRVNCNVAVAGTPNGDVADGISVETAVAVKIGVLVKTSVDVVCEPPSLV